ncbi:MAG: ThuA domain-containing protein [Opitutaceae bacterium]|nr:ThuA domain-containing protein [Opitutaceae bacterium]
MKFRRALFWFSFALASLSLGAAPTTAPARVLIIVGPSNHPPGSHEVAASGRLLKHCVEHMDNLPGVQVDLVNEWPVDRSRRDRAATVILLGDTFPAMRLPNAQRNLADLAEMMARGCGIVCVHYSTGLRAEDVAGDGEHPLLHWTGGYFATRCKHHQSVAKIFPSVTISPAAANHPVSRGWREFTVSEEPYYNNYFGRDGNRLAPGVTALATSMLPPESPKREIVAWSIERPDGGRGFGIVMPHFYRNWKNEDLRRFILNGVAWTAKLEVPATGVRTTLPDLATFAPESIEPKPRETKAKASAAQPKRK